MKNLVDKMKARIEQEGLSVVNAFTTTEVDNTTREIFDGIWQLVWNQEEFHDGSLEDVIKHYALYEEHSTDILLWLQGQPIGTMRIVWNEDNGTPALNDFIVDESWKEKRCAEFTLLTVLPEWRGLKHLTSFVLWKEGCRYLLERGIDNIVLIADTNLINLFEKVGFVVHKVSPEEKPYEGPVMCSVYVIVYSENYERSNMNPLVYEFFTT